MGLLKTVFEVNLGLFLKDRRYVSSFTIHHFHIYCALTFT